MTLDLTIIIFQSNQIRLSYIRLLRSASFNHRKYHCRYHTALRRVDIADTEEEADSPLTSTAPPLAICPNLHSNRRLTGGRTSTIVRKTTTHQATWELSSLRIIIILLFLCTGLLIVLEEHVLCLLKSGQEQGEQEPEVVEEKNCRIRICAQQHRTYVYRRFPETLCPNTP